MSASVLRASVKSRIASPASRMDASGPSVDDTAGERLDP
jgi:hypothetical protein